MRVLTGLVGGVAALSIATATLAGGHGGTPPEVAARIGHMNVYQHFAGILFGMAQDKVPYDAELAMTAATGLAAMTKVDQSTYWTPGTDSESLEGTRALPAIWDNIPDVIRISQDLGAAADTMAGVAGDGLDAVKGNIRAIGAACSECHEDYRAPKR